MKLSPILCASVLALAALGTTAYAKEDIKAVSPAGTACRINGVDGVSQWSDGFKAWSCNTTKALRTFIAARTANALKSGRRVHTPIVIVRDPN